MSLPIMDSAANMDVAGAYITLHPTNLEQNILSHPNMTLMYRGDDGYTDESASDEDSMPGLVNDSDDEDDEEKADGVHQHTDANVIPTEFSYVRYHDTRGLFLAEVISANALCTYKSYYHWLSLG